MNTFDNAVKNLSYTNKDFTAIYKEALDLIKSISYRWDPTISDEASPGVLLVKLNAILADKLNYNTDKNILENFPVSVTQEGQARAVFSDRGYKMHWYKGAEGNLSIAWNGDRPDEEVIYTIPKFSAFSHEDNEIVFTTTQSVDISSTGEAEIVPAIQGTVLDYDVNGETTISVADLDSDNRLFFTEYNIAQNGIFIDNANPQEIPYGEGFEWKLVDNLAAQELNSRVYEFGVDNETNACYIKFPTDADYLFGSGIKVKYTKTLGTDGNVRAKYINSVYGSLNPISNGEVLDSVDSSSILVTNSSSITNGFDPETIESAYKSYKKTVGTFNTLVTLRDYINAISRSEVASNCFVTDRTNDIQGSYYIVTSSEDKTSKKLVQDSNIALDPFSLKLYALKYSANPTDFDAYNASFEMLHSLNELESNYGDIDQTEQIKAFINDLQSIQHEFATIQSNMPAYVKNKFSLDLKIIPQYAVSIVQQADITANIVKALSRSLNANEIEFGEQLTHSEVYDIILNSDNRIKDLILSGVDSTDFITFVGYFDGYRYNEVQINGDGYSDYTLMSNKPSDWGTNTTNYYSFDGSTYTPVTSSTTWAKDTYYNNFAKLFKTEIFAKCVLDGVSSVIVPKNNFTFTMQQHSALISDDVARIDTDVTLTVPKATSYTLRENENVRFTTPNMLGGPQFSNGVKYLYYGADVSSGGTYKLDLSANEFIAFFRKEEDSDDAPYYMYKYNASSEFNCVAPTNFTLKDNSEQSELSQEFISYVRAAGAGEHILVSSDYTNDIAKMLKSIFTLTGTKQIGMQKKAEVTYTDNKVYYAYWILNTSKKQTYKGIDETNVYELFPEHNAAQSYTLKNGEFFVLTDAKKSFLQILGSGTILKRQAGTGVTTLPAWVVPVISDLDIISDGASAIADDLWQKFNSQKINFTITEQQVITIGEGVTLKYITTGSATYKQITSSITTLASNETFSYNEEQLPYSAYGWACQSVLNLNMSQTKPQYFESGQHADIYDRSGTPIGDLAGYYAQSSYPIIFDGGYNLDVTSIDAQGNTLYPSLYKYGLATYDADSKVTYSGETISIEIDPDAEDPEVTWPDDSVSSLLPVGNYIVKLYNPVGTDFFDSLKFKIGNTEVEEFSTGSTELKAKGVHYLALTVPSGTISNFSIEWEVNSSTTITNPFVISISKVFGYELNPDITDSSFASDIIDKIKALDTDGIFDFTYIPEESQYIKNPISSESFFDVQHPYNKFMICQLRTGLDKNGKNYNKVVFSNVVR